MLTYLEATHRKRDNLEVSFLKCAKNRYNVGMGVWKHPITVPTGFKKTPQ